MPFPVVFIAGVFDVYTKTLTTFTTASAINVVGNPVQDAARYEAHLGSLNVPSFSNTPVSAARDLLSTADTKEEAPLSLASLNTSRTVYSSPYTILVCFNVLGLTLGTTNETSVVATAAKIAASSPTLIFSLAYPALIALVANFSSFPLAYVAPSISLTPTISLSSVTIVLLPRVHVYSTGGGDISAATAAFLPTNVLTPAFISAIALAALALCALCILFALWRRRKRKEEKVIAPELVVEGSVFLKCPVGDPEKLNDVDIMEEGDREAVLSSLDLLVARANAVKNRATAPGLALAPPKLSLITPEERQARQAHFRALSEETRKSEKLAQLMALPKHARILVSSTVKDSRKWWSAPRVNAKYAKLHSEEWEPLAKEKAAVLAAGGMWPPPDPLLALLSTGEGKIVNGMVVRVAGYVSKTGDAAKDTQAEAKFLKNQELIRKGLAIAEKRKATLMTGGNAGGKGYAILRTAALASTAFKPGPLASPTSATNAAKEDVYAAQNAAKEG